MGARPLVLKGELVRVSDWAHEAVEKTVPCEKPFCGRSALREEPLRGETLRMKRRFMEGAVSCIPFSF